jgi:acyl-CoA thioesterase II
LPLDELDIRIADHGEGAGFTRRLYWRTTVPLPDEALLHTCLGLFVTDVYMIDAALRVHGHSMRDRSHRSGTTDASVWFHRPIRADRWNLLETRSPAAARGRGVVTGQFVDAGGAVCATVVQEGLIAAREYCAEHNQGKQRQGCGRSSRSTHWWQPKARSWAPATG